MHLPQLISDLAIILAVAGFVTLLFKKIGQPVVLGYLLAGILVGPEVSLLPTVQDQGAIRVWAEIGVIILLFGLGLEFSFKRLMSVGRGASITGLTEVISMLAIGFLVGKAFGWKNMDALFLGGILSISSTTIIIRAIDELGYRQRGFVPLVFGVLVVEDLVAILLMVLLSTIAVSSSFEGLQLLKETGRLGFLLTLWFVGGVFLVPWFLKKIRPLMNEETSLVVSLGLCLSMVVLATKSGFSPALGAFMMGSIFAETSDGERIEHLIRPVRDLFAAIFFVSIGMLIETSALKTYALPIVVIVLVTIFGKLITSAFGALLSGQSLRHSVQAGMSLAQIGEFSFIIATLGVTLKVTSDFLYPIAVAVSAVTTFTTPYMIRAADPLHRWIEGRLPQVWKDRLQAHHQGQRAGISSNRSAHVLTKVFINSMIVIAIALGSAKWTHPWLLKTWGEQTWVFYVSLFTTIFMTLPFLWAIANPPRKVVKTSLSREEVRALSKQATFSFVARSFVAMSLLGFTIGQFTSGLVTFLVVFVLSVLLATYEFRNFDQIYDWFEKSFLANLNQKDLEKSQQTDNAPKLAPWDAHLSELSLHPESIAVGQNLANLEIKEKFGVMVALIQRGSKQILAPGRETILMAYDRVFAIGTDDQLFKLNQFLAMPQARTIEESQDYGLSSLRIGTASSFLGKAIRQSGVREATNGIIVGIERNGERILNPDSGLQLIEGDLLWIVGKRDLIEQLSVEDHTAST